MPNLGNKIKSLKSIFGLSSSPKISLSALKKEKFKQTNKKICRKSSKGNTTKINTTKINNKTKTNENIFGPKKKT